MKVDYPFNKNYFSIMQENYGLIKNLSVWSLVLFNFGKLIKSYEK